MKKREVGRKGNNKARVGARCLDGWRKERVQKQCVSLESVKDVTNDSLSRGECVLAPPIVAIRLFAVTHCRAGAEKGQAERPREILLRLSLEPPPLAFCDSSSPSVAAACENVIRHGSLGMF